METLSVLLMLFAMIGAVASIVGLIKGNLKFLKIDSRKKAGLALAGFFILFIIAGAIFPTTNEHAEVATSSSNQIADNTENIAQDLEKIDIEKEVAHEEKTISQDEEISKTTSETTSEKIEQDKPSPSLPATPKGDLTVHYIDVGQGDATLLQGTDFTILIDAGRHDKNDVIPYLKSVGVDNIDLLIGTHPHADHIGQMDKVINSFPVSEVWMSGGTATSKTFERVLDAIAESDASYHEPRAGEEFQVGDLQIKVIHPSSLTGDLNDDSLSVRMQYGEIVFAFTGDTEKGGEQKIVNRGYDIKAHILQAGHHGSRTSSTPVFLDAVRPEVVIYSAGAGNSYGHPHSEVIERLLSKNIKVYGTDVNGTVKVVTDGNSYNITTSRSGQVKIEQTSTPSPTPAPDPTPPPTPSSSGSININTASIEELQEIIHIGEARAKAIIDGRPWNSLNQLTNISGISDNRLNDIKAQGKAYVD